MSITVQLAGTEAHALVEDWQEQLRTLLNQIEEWARTQALPVVRTEASIQEEGLPPYITEILEIPIDDENRIYVEPIARFTLNGRGVVELYGWPSLRRVRLQPAVPPGAGWVVMTDSGIPLHQDWNSENFAVLIRDLVA